MSQRRFVVLVEEELPINASPIEAPGSVDDPNVRRATLNQLFAERVRSIDQIKRLYAVIMGYVLTNCATNIYHSLSSHPQPSPQLYTIIAAQSITLTSLLFLFYLATERTLDTRYLNIRRISVPNRFFLLVDLFTIFGTAAFFVVLSNSFPVDDTSDVFEVQKGFSKILYIFYGLDVLFLLLQIAVAIIGRLSRHISIYDKGKKKILLAHVVWLLVNIFFFSVFWSSYNSYWPISGFLPDYVLGVNLLSFILIVLHTFRFFADFLIGYKFYYPQDDLPSSKDLFSTNGD